MDELIASFVKEKKKVKGGQNAIQKIQSARQD